MKVNQFYLFIFHMLDRYILVEVSSLLSICIDIVNVQHKKHKIICTRAQRYNILH